MDWLALLAVQGTRLLQHHSSKESILLCPAFFIVQLSHPHMTTGKTIAMTRRTFVGKVTSLLLNMLFQIYIYMCVLHIYIYGNAKECSNYHKIVLISHASKVMLKILQARLQQYMNHELPDVQAGFRKGRGTRDQIANIH